ncbi:MAG TPA: peptide-methionine (S)-S-oxide reductase MsrA [Alphaproteobacteria bacterium]|jgi:peptide-methionine (S)-S-oxide reductase|nr:peptide-methionine (S)-S-oxide reductase MsrA [Alphaproteobacteria bacterium]MDP6271265.1 peptide-methionine (S)-S-oxide reductase MsrA [Alphaproteobacteria bacterium]MDP7429668.1 peptide-methionine (S)-S-oxide reductase MsrA [Alphaproteobacteria bacterium]HJM52302.1 peptide-methionine (S)-S-oxide reductase MsrA [Alphaproteobacteria bacterium]|tara:strand:- start:700 stop:1167 length:468 start_codon:yes stop_codon:yes gene_type:complete
MATATFGAGCFWGVEAAFRKIQGVSGTAVGYAGGTVDEPTYEAVCRGTTGHAEVVRLEFDPRRVSYDQLLELFFEIHDPTQFNRQGPDVGTQYRSVIFFHDADQQAAAREAKARIQASGNLPGPVVTEISAAGDFWPAEDYHQQYFEKTRGRRWG